MTKEDIINEAKKRHPESKPRNYFNEGQRVGFIEGALWAITLLKKYENINQSDFRGSQGQNRGDSIPESTRKGNDRRGVVP